MQSKINFKLLDILHLQKLPQYIKYNYKSGVITM